MKFIGSLLFIFISIIVGLICILFGAGPGIFFEVIGFMVISFWILIGLLTGGLIAKVLSSR